MVASKLKQACILAVVFVFLITSCSVVSSEMPVTPSPVVLKITPSVSPTPTHILVIPSLTYTPIPATPTIPVPTLSAKEKEIVINQLLAEDHKCMLPCWGGVEPGVTTWTDAKIFLQQFAQIYSSQSGIHTAEFQYKAKNLVLKFYTHNSIVEFIGVPRFEYPLYRLLQEYGKPDEVYFYILDVLPIDTNNPYTVYLFYKDAGILAEYNGVSPKGETISVCFENGHEKKSSTTFLSLWPKSSDKTFSEVITQYLNRFSDYSSLKYYKLEELSTYTNSDFFEFYKLEENENQCLQIKNPNPKSS